MHPTLYSKGNKTRSIGNDECILYFQCLDQLFTTYVNRFAEDTDRRKNFIENNQHLLAGTVLCSMFAYLESTLGGKSKEKYTWIERHGGRAVDELKCLRTVRNAFVHTNSNIMELDSCTTYEIDQLTNFIKKLETGKVADDKGNKYPCYMHLSEKGDVTLIGSAIGVFTSIGRAICH